MFNLSWFWDLLGSHSGEVKIAIIGLRSVGKSTLLKRLSSKDIQTIKVPHTKFLQYETGRSRRFNMNFVMAYVGYSEPALMKKWIADQFCDSDGIIFVIDDDFDSHTEAREWITCYAEGFVPHHGPEFFLKVREGIPWLVLGNDKRKESSFTTENIQKTMGLDSLNIDWHVEVVNLLTGEGVEKAIMWLRQRLDTPIEEREPSKAVKQ